MEQQHLDSVLCPQKPEVLRRGSAVVAGELGRVHDDPSSLLLLHGGTAEIGLGSPAVDGDLVGDDVVVAIVVVDGVHVLDLLLLCELTGTAGC